MSLIGICLIEARMSMRIWTEEALTDCRLFNPLTGSGWYRTKRTNVANQVQSNPTLTIPKEIWWRVTKSEYSWIRDQSQSNPTLIIPNPVREKRTGQGSPQSPYLINERHTTRPLWARIRMPCDGLTEQWTNQPHHEPSTHQPWPCSWEGPAGPSKGGGRVGHLERDDRQCMSEGEDRQWYSEKKNRQECSNREHGKWHSEREHSLGKGGSTMAAARICHQDIAHSSLSLQCGHIRWCANLTKCACVDSQPRTFTLYASGYFRRGLGEYMKPISSELRTAPTPSQFVLVSLKT